MIKNDKVLCIKEHIHPKFSPKLGEIYYIDIIDHSDDTVYIIDHSYDSVYISTGETYGLWYSLDCLPETPPFEKDFPYFYTYFILLSEWREQQINSILDEN